VDAAADAGDDAVKFQTFRAEGVVSELAPAAAYQVAATGYRTQLEMLRRLELSVDDHRVLIDHCLARGILFLSTPHDGAAADLLDALNVPAFKVGSGDLANHPFLQKLALLRRPVILSTGMATLAEVAAAVGIFHAAGHADVVLLHCVSRYPADIGDCNLRAIHTMREALHLPVGFSDHTLDLEAAVAAVALGACVIEKHLTLDRSLPGPDHAMSLDPAQFRHLVQCVRRVERALGDGIKAPVPGEYEVMRVARKSVVAAVDIPKGTTITREMLAVKRPGTGIQPGFIDLLVGRQAKVDIARDEVLRWEWV
jgi:sialic acid synthase SpsE